MDNSTNNQPIEVIYDELEASHGQKGFTDSVGRMLRKIGVLDTDALAENLAALHDKMGHLFQRIGESASNYELESFEVVVDFTAKGGIRLVGAASGEFKGGIKLTFSKKDLPVA